MELVQMGRRSRVAPRMWNEMEKKEASFDSGSEHGPSSMTRIDRMEGRWKAIAIQSLGVLLLINGALALLAFREFFSLREEMGLSLSRSEERFQSLDAQIQFDSQRRQLLLGLRDQILGTRPELGPARAYNYALLALRATEKYPSVDPLMLVAIGIVESRYDEEATSPAGARGLYQLHPSTGRLLARALGWEYTDDLLHDPVRNTELATFYLEILFAAYNDERMVLAEYNGGPLNAGYLRAGVKRLAPETKAYVRKVTEIHSQMREELPFYAPPLEPHHREISTGRFSTPRDHSTSVTGSSGVPASLAALPELSYASPPLAGR